MKNSSPVPRRVLITAGVFLSLFLVLSVIHLLFGRITGDEGWYALSVRNVMEGKLPYKDFCFTQMPLMPYIYAPAFYLFGSDLLTARLLSLGFSLIALIFTMAVCYRRAGYHGLFLSGALLALNFNYIFDTVSVRTQPFTVAVTAVLIFLVSGVDRARGGWVKIAVALVLINIGFLARLSLLPALAMTWAYALWIYRRQWPLIFGLGIFNLLILGAVLHFFDIGGNMWFGIYDSYHEYYGSPPWSWQNLVYHFFRGWLENQWLIVFGLVWGLVMLALRLVSQLKGRNLEEWPIFEIYLAASYFGIMLIHVINVQSHPTHQTSIIIYAVVLGACAIGRALSNLKDLEWRRAILASFVILALLNAPSQEWVVHFNGNGSLGRVSDVTKVIKENSRPDDKLLAFNAELAVNSGRSLLGGYDMSEFSYYPMMSDERIEKLHLTNVNKLLRDISSAEAKVLVVGNYEFSIMSANNPQLADKLKQLINESYVEVAKFDNYGQFFNTIIVFKRKF